MVTRLALFLFLVPLSEGAVIRPTYEPISRPTRNPNEWHCGIGNISGGISNALTYFSPDQQKINECCIEHDDLLDAILEYGLNRMEVDRVFCQCLDNVGSPYVRFVIQPLFCTAIRTYSMIFHRDS